MGSTVSEVTNVFQIQSSKVEQILEILRHVKSSYYSAFKDVCGKVNEGKSSFPNSFIYLLMQDVNKSKIV